MSRRSPAGSEKRRRSASSENRRSASRNNRKTKRDKRSRTPRRNRSNSSDSSDEESSSNDKYKTKKLKTLKWGSYEFRNPKEQQKIIKKVRHMLGDKIKMSKLGLLDFELEENEEVNELYELNEQDSATLVLMTVKGIMCLEDVIRHENFIQDLKKDINEIKNKTLVEEDNMIGTAFKVLELAKRRTEASLMLQGVHLERIERLRRFCVQRQPNSPNEVQFDYEVFTKGKGKQNFTYKFATELEDPLLQVAKVVGILTNATSMEKILKLVKNETPWIAQLTPAITAAHVVPILIWGSVVGPTRIFTETGINKDYRKTFHPATVRTLIEMLQRLELRFETTRKARVEATKKVETIPNIDNLATKIPKNERKRKTMKKRQK